MSRIVICGGPRTGKTTLARKLGGEVFVGDPAEVRTIRHMDDLIAETCWLGRDGWSAACRTVASEWLPAPGPWIIEGVAMARALRKWREAHPGAAPPVDRVIRLTAPYRELSKGQATMAKGEETVWREIEGWLLDAPDVAMEVRGLPLRVALPDLPRLEEPERDQSSAAMMAAAIVGPVKR